MHSTLKQEDPFNSSHRIGVHSHTSHVEDFMSSQLILMMIEKYVMVDLCNCTKV